jgi:hypothetical protein
VQFEWNPAKARENERKHGVAFEEASGVFEVDHKSGMPMKTKDHDLRPEYPADLIEQGICRKHAKRYREGTNVVVIEPDVHEHFPDSAVCQSRAA